MSDSGNLSDWDVLAIDEEGRPNNGTSDCSLAGVFVEIRENYLNVCSDSLWKPGCLQKLPIIATLPFGELVVFDIGIVAERCDRNGILWATWFTAGDSVHAITGISCSGWLDNKWTGITADDVAHLQDRLRNWARDGKVPARLAMLAFDRALRYNQGDRFFAKNLNYALPATRPGEAETPLLYQSRAFDKKEAAPASR